jgi:hypothetical protein
LAASSDAFWRSFYRNAKALHYMLCLVVGVTVVHGASAADMRDKPADPGTPIPFELPAQPLASAVESYSVASGWQVIYKASLASGRRSSEVKGNFTPEAALRILLEGTGLVPRYKAVDGVILAPDPAALLAQDNTADDVAPSLKDYYGLIQTGLMRTLCASPQIRASSYRIALAFWIGSSGVVARTALLGSTGHADIDGRVDQAIRSLSVGAAPPAGFAQPVVLLVTPDLVGKCGPADAGMPPIRAEQ